MVKGGKTFLKILIVILLIVFLNFIFFGLKYDLFKVGMTGFSVQGDIKNVYSQIPFNSKLFVIIEWIFFAFALVFIIVRDKKIARETSSTTLNIKKLRGGSKTDIDVLYDLLNQEKKLKLSSISSAFDLDKEVVFEWCKILESANLAIIDYPGFGEPVIKSVNLDSKILNDENLKKPNSSLISENNKENSQKIPEKTLIAEKIKPKPLKVFKKFKTKKSHKQ
jgi:hypothetical protein